jgi:hypothetical protein
LKRRSPWWRRRRSASRCRARGRFPCRPAWWCRRARGRGRRSPREAGAIVADLAQDPVAVAAGAHRQPPAAVHGVHGVDGVADQLVLRGQRPPGGTAAPGRPGQLVPQAGQLAGLLSSWVRPAVTVPRATSRSRVLTVCWEPIPWMANPSSMWVAIGEPLPHRRVCVPNTAVQPTIQATPTTVEAQRGCSDALFGLETKLPSSPHP